LNGRSPLFRLIALYCALLLLLGAAFAYFTMHSFAHYVRETTLRGVRARSIEIWHTARTSLTDGASLANLMELRFAPEAQYRYIRIAQGKSVFYESGIPPGTNLKQLRALGATVNSGELQFGSLVVVRRNFGARGRTITIDSGQSEEFAGGVEHDLLRSILFGLPVLLVLAALGGYVLMRRSLKPVEMMIDAAEAITFNDPGNRLPLAGTGDRIEILALALNRMLDRLDNAYQYANRFSADAAHELRTPLAIIRGELEFIAGQEIPESLREALRNTLSEVARLTELVEHLSLLSGAQILWGKHAHTNFDLFELAAETMEQMRLLADEKGLILEPISGSTAVVNGDRNRLKQVVVNLLDNAIKYTDPGGRIVVQVTADAHRARLILSDTGIGIAAEHHEDIFRRFFRVSTNRGETGSGLGLAIARSICSVHGGTIAVESDPRRGSTFRVELPLGSPQYARARKRKNTLV